MKRNGLILAMTLLMLLVSRQTAWGQADDRVYGDKGTPNIGTISKISPTEVTVNVRGADKTLEVNTILKVAFGTEPRELDNARDHVRRGAYNDANTELAKIDINSVRQAEVKQDVEYYRALTAAKLALSGEAGSVVDAGKAMVKFVEDEAYNKSHHYYEAVEVLGDLYMTGGYFDLAEKTYQKLEQAPWADYKMRAKVSVAESQLAQKKFTDALGNYKQVAEASINTPEANRQKQFAKVGMAVCTADSAPDQGVKLVEEIIREGDPQDMELFGRAYNALGACHMKAGRNREALMAYLHTDILFYRDPEAHAEALYNLNKLWLEQKNSERALRADQTLKSSYGGSRWAKQ